jgi:integral membrane protein
LLSIPISRLRLTGILEGISYLLLLGVAMPLKYFGNKPEAVLYAGWVHGLLFVLFCLALLHVWIVRKWPIQKAAIAFIASLLPFGTFVLDKSLRKEAAALIEN